MLRNNMRSAIAITKKIGDKDWPDDIVGQVLDLVTAEELDLILYAIHPAMPYPHVFVRLQTDEVKVCKRKPADGYQALWAKEVLSSDGSISKEIIEEIRALCEEQK